jgi:trehalose 6-phosphate phosphatase
MDHEPAAGPARADRVGAPLEWPAPAALAATIIARARSCGGLLLCTDFDGTLAPIAPTPDQASALPEAQAALAWLSRSGAGAGAVPVRVAVVTSRNADDAARRLGLGPEAVAIGSSGLERLVDGRLEVDPAVTPWLDALAAAAAALQAALEAGEVPGARLERKHCGAVLHTRSLPAAADEQAAALAAAVATPRGLSVVAGKRAFEVRPPLRVDKADAVEALRAGRWKVAALCVAGDDIPDVGMLELAAGESGGTAIAVADAETPRAVLAAAQVAVAGPPGWASTLAEISSLLGAPVVG